MVELRTRKRQMRSVGTNRHEKLRCEILSCASECAIPDTACTSPDPACSTTGTRPPQPNQASCTLDISRPLVSSTAFSSSTPISDFLVHNSTIIAEHKVKSSFCICPCHDHELTPSTAYTEYSIHRVQHTLCMAYTKLSMVRVQQAPSTAYTEYSIHRVQHTPSTAYTEYSIHPILFLFPSFS